MFGKWHLSAAKKPPASEPFNPDKQGFDKWQISYKSAPHADPETDTHNVKAITARSRQFLQRNRERSFFLFESHNTVHTPVIGRPRLVEKYKRKAGARLPENNPVLAAMIEELDESVGRLLKKLEELNLANNTMVVFFSDNGGLERVTSQRPLRSGKANLYEGGIRVPLIVRWSGVVKAGSKCSVPVISNDFFPTLAEAAGIKSDRSAVDGVSLLPLLKQTGGMNREALYWHYPHYHLSSIGPCGAVRAGDWKLIEWFDESICGQGRRFELYNLKKDVGEQRNLAGQMPQKARELKEMLETWRKEVAAQRMMQNPNYDPEKAQKSKK
jgi:uncharacterized sulfatase